MAGAEHDGVLAGERLWRGEVRDLITNQVRRRALAEGGQPVRARRVRLPPGPRRVDHGPCFHSPLLAVRARDVHGERLGVPAGVHEPVPALARHARHPRAIADPAPERAGERG